jgi:hypothetical protein
LESRIRRKKPDRFGFAPPSPGFIAKSLKTRS